MNDTIKYDEFGGTPRVICTDCQRWEYLSKGGKIRHSSRCDYPQAQYNEQPKRIEQPSGNIHPRMDSNAKTSDELLEGVQKGYLSMSDAMNSDY